ncbi:(2Fe-2S)-binding protein [uncultured Enterovirga sp.]|uniref:(2Fe-2S)-binding protein n=1 Tax=uncultured Enterovirga sp. TaxID=2026352 RepID=UPI0035C9C582
MRSSLRLNVNGVVREVETDPDAPLLAVLRNELDLKSARFGCGHERCGACMVLLDGIPVYSCTLPVSAVRDGAITTVEGLGDEAAPHPIQMALIEEQAGQCGYCLSGIQISAAALLARTTSPSHDEIKTALEPNLCRCGVHLRVIRAVERAATMLREGVPA